MKYWPSWTDWFPVGQRKPFQTLTTRLRASGWSLRLRLLLWVGLALLPPALFGIYQGMTAAERDVGEVRERLIATARGATTPDQNILASAEQVALALSNQPDIRNASERCNADLAGALRGLSFFTNLNRVNAKGRIVCSARKAAIGVDASRQSIWPSVTKSTGFVVSGVTESRLAHRPVLIGLLPLRDSKGRFYGSVDVVIDVRWLDHVLKSSRLPPQSVAAIFDRNRVIIASNDPDNAKAIFSRTAFDARSSETVQNVNDPKGRSWYYAIAPLLGEHIYVGFAMQETHLFGPTYQHTAIDFVVPILMILLAWTAIWVVTERQLTRWIVYLRKFAAAYSSGHYALRPALNDAPSEFRLLGDAMAEMAAAIQDRDRSLRDAVTQKTLLVKEIHHRVKNNLQIVMSLLSLQAGRLEDPAAQETLRLARSRINALALIHRLLYEIDDERTVDVRHLLELLAAQTAEVLSSGRKDIRVTVDALPRQVTGDTAVPLALLTVEAMTNAFRHAFPPGQAGVIHIALKTAESGTLELAIEDNGIGFDDRNTPDRLGARLIKTLGHQIGGKAEIHSQIGNGTKVELVFPDSEAPARAPENP